MCGVPMRRGMKRRARDYPIVLYRNFPSGIQTTNHINGSAKPDSRDRNFVWNRQVLEYLFIFRVVTTIRKLTIRITGRYWGKNTRSRESMKLGAFLLRSTNWNVSVDLLLCLGSIRRNPFCSSTRAQEDSLLIPSLDGSR